MPTVDPLKMQTRKPIKRQPSSGRGNIRISSAAADAVDYPETIKDWTDEELRRGRRKDRNGKFTGRDPIVVPTNCYREMVRREIRKAQQTMGENLHDAVEVLAGIATNPMSEDKDIIKACQVMMDRVMGKNPETVEVTVKQPLFLGILSGGIVPGDLSEIGTGDDGGELPILDGEVISDSEDDDLIWE